MILLLQFIIHFFICAAIGMMWQPILTSAGYDNSLYDNASLQEIAVRDAFWYFGVIISVVGAFANIIWYFNERRLKAEQ